MADPYKPNKPIEGVTNRPRTVSEQDYFRPDTEAVTPAENVQTPTPATTEVVPQETTQYSEANPSAADLMKRVEIENATNNSYAARLHGDQIVSSRGEENVPQWVDAVMTAKELSESKNPDDLYQARDLLLAVHNEAAKRTYDIPKDDLEKIDDSLKQVAEIEAQNVKDELNALKATLGDRVESKVVSQTLEPIVDRALKLVNEGKAHSFGEAINILETSNEKDGAIKRFQNILKNEDVKWLARPLTSDFLKKAETRTSALMYDENKAYAMGARNYDRYFADEYAAEKKAYSFEKFVKDQHYGKNEIKLSGDTPSFMGIKTPDLTIVTENKEPDQNGKLAAYNQEIQKRITTRLAPKLNPIQRMAANLKENDTQSKEGLWRKYDEDHNQSLRKPWETESKTAIERDNEWKTLPLEAATMAVAGWAAKPVAGYVEKIVIKKLGEKLAATALGKTLGLAAEGVVFSETNVISGAVRSGDLNNITDPKMHLEAALSSIKTLGLFKAQAMLMPATAGLLSKSGEPIYDRIAQFTVGIAATVPVVVATSDKNDLHAALVSHINAMGALSVFSSGAKAPASLPERAPVKARMGEPVELPKSSVGLATPETIQLNAGLPLDKAAAAAGKIADSVGGAARKLGDFVRGRKTTKSAPENVRPQQRLPIQVDDIIEMNAKSGNARKIDGATMTGVGDKVFVRPEGEKTTLAIKDLDTGEVQFLTRNSTGELQPGKSYLVETETGDGSKPAMSYQIYIPEVLKNPAIPATPEPQATTKPEHTIVNNGEILKMDVTPGSRTEINGKPIIVVNNSGRATLDPTRTDAYIHNGEGRRLLRNDDGIVTKDASFTFNADKTSAPKPELVLYGKSGTIGREIIPDGIKKPATVQIPVADNRVSRQKEFVYGRRPSDGKTILEHRNPANQAKIERYLPDGTIDKSFKPEILHERLADRPKTDMELMKYHKEEAFNNTRTELEPGRYKITLLGEVNVKTKGTTDIGTAWEPITDFNINIQ